MFCGIFLPCFAFLSFFLFLWGDQIKSLTRRLGAGAILNIDSDFDVERINALGKNIVEEDEREGKHGRRTIRLLVRVNPDLDPNVSLYSKKSAVLLFSIIVLCPDRKRRQFLQGMSRGSLLSLQVHPHISTGPAKSKFGVPSKQLAEVASKLNRGIFDIVRRF